mgnify:CR=1 FL=1|tara:strand:+ start:224 stop:397 length:174 start_codon:yes stop_codon:yes gene_type:complete
MSNLKTLDEFVKWLNEIVFGKEEKQKPKKRKRARKKDGTFKADDKSTPNINEAWEDE